jgi:hypothetical protein
MFTTPPAWRERATRAKCRYRDGGKAEQRRGGDELEHARDVLDAAIEIGRRGERLLGPYG